MQVIRAIRGYCRGTENAMESNEVNTRRRYERAASLASMIFI